MSKFWQKDLLSSGAGFDLAWLWVSSHSLIERDGIRSLVKQVRSRVNKDRERCSACKTLHAEALTRPIKISQLITSSADTTVNYLDIYAARSDSHNGNRWEGMARCFSDFFTAFPLFSIVQKPTLCLITADPRKTRRASNLKCESSGQRTWLGWTSREGESQFQQQINQMLWEIKCAFGEC